MITNDTFLVEMKLWHLKELIAYNCLFYEYNRCDGLKYLTTVVNKKWISNAFCNISKFPFMRKHEYQKRALP